MAFAAYLLENANVNARLDSVIGQVAEIKARLDIYEKDTSDLKVTGAPNDKPRIFGSLFSR